jgi:hypothetical protein
VILHDKLVDKFTSDIVDSAIQEVYRKPIFSFINKLVQNILEGNLEAIFNKYRILILPVDPIGERLVYNCSYDQLNYLYKFEVRDDIDEIKKIRKKLKQEIKEAYIHEETHAQQNQGKHRLQPYDNGDGELKGYLSQYQEISAMARQVAFSVKSRTKLSDIDTIRAIANNSTKLNKLPVEHKSIIREYRNIGGKAWRDFLKSVYKYFCNADTYHLGKVDY